MTRYGQESACGWRSFEDEVFAEVQRLVQSRQLFVDPRHSKVVRNGKYYSRDRDGDVLIEIAIESYNAGAEEPSLVWLWECKDETTSRRKVEVSVIEVLNDKIRQLGSSRCKGSVVTTHGFQSGAIKLARSTGVSLAVLEKRFEWITKYAKDVPDELHEVVFARYFLTSTGEEREDQRLEDVFGRENFLSGDRF